MNNLDKVNSVFESIKHIDEMVMNFGMLENS